MLGIDQETATIYSLCKAFKVKSVALLRVMDAHRKGQEMGKGAYSNKEKQNLINLVRKAVLLSIQRIENST